MVAQNPSLRWLSPRVHEKYELRMSSASRRPASNRRWTESGMNAWSPASVLSRFLLLATYVGRFLAEKSSAFPWDRSDEGVDQSSPFALLTAISPRSPRTSSGASSR